MELSERLAYLGEILALLSASPLPSHQFQTIAENAGTILFNDYIGIALVDPDQPGYQLHSLVGQATDLLPKRFFTLEEGIVGAVVRSGRAITSGNLSQNPYICPDLEGIGIHLGWQSALVIPLRQGERTIGSLYIAHHTANAYTQEDLQIANLLATGLSATLETSRLYQTLADERSVLTALLASTKDAILLVSPNQTILLANPAVRQMCGMDNEAIVGKPLSIGIQNAQLLRLLTSSDAETVTDLPLSDGRTAQASLVQVKTPFGEQVGQAAILRDITLLKQLEQMKNEFVHTVSHDLKNPISTLILATSLLARTGELNEQQRGLQQRILSTAAYMNQLVGDLLDLGQIEARLGLEISLMNLVGLALDVWTEMQPQVEAKGQTVFLDMPNEIWIQGDKGRLRQVLMNLLGNAVKYTPEGGKIQMVMNAGTHIATTKIIDDGIGIPAPSLPHLFDKFYRVQNQATQNIPGTGLGLAIVKSIIEAHHGSVWVESKEGKGSTFAFNLPKNGTKIS